MDGVVRSLPADRDQRAQLGSAGVACAEAIRHDRREQREYTRKTERLHTWTPAAANSLRQRKRPEHSGIGADRAAAAKLYEERLFQGPPGRCTTTQCGRSRRSWNGPGADLDKIKPKLLVDQREEDEANAPEPAPSNGR